jgi:hypothetical protein
LLSHTNGTGGATLLVDGLYVASILKDLHPEVYEILSRVPVTAHAAGEPDILYRASAPVLSHDANGTLARVRWNNDDRSSVKDVQPKEMAAWWVSYSFSIFNIPSTTRAIFVALFLRPTVFCFGTLVWQGGIR